MPFTSGSRAHRDLDTLWDSAPAAIGRFDPTALHQLPAGARRYLEHALAPGAPLATAVRLSMTGTIKLNGAWHPFEAEQVLRWDRGFLWAARAWLNHLPVTGFDRLLDGDGEMRWRLFGLVPVMSAGGEQIARAAAGRLHCEAMWMPAALLGSDVGWSEVDAGHPHARIHAHGEDSELVLELDDAGAVRACWLDRWGDLGTGTFGYHRFGGTAEQDHTVDGITIPTRHRVGWGFGTDAFAEGEFFRCELHDIRFR
ncbi:MAG: DUF6544 family protein [Myxococcota bacterium]